MLLLNFNAHLKHVRKLEIAVRVFGSFFAYGVERGSCVVGVALSHWLLTNLE